MTTHSSHTWPVAPWGRCTGRQRAVRAGLARLVPVGLAVAAAIYFAHAYLPVGVAYYRVLTEVRAMIHAGVSLPRPRGASALAREIEHRTGVAVDPRDVRIRHRGSELDAVQLRLKLPLKFPLLGSGRALIVDVAAGAEQRRE